jgi:hypothetical protein
MKKNKILQRYILTTVVASAVAGTVAQAQYLNTFDSGTSPWAFEFGAPSAVANHSVTFASGPIFDASGNAASGSAKLTWTWNHTADGDGSAAFRADVLASPGQSFVGGTLSFDIYLDSSSIPGGLGDYGYFQIITRNTDAYTFNDMGVGKGLLNFVTAPGQWKHVSVPLDTVHGDHIRAITIQDYDDAMRGIDGTMTIYIDNLQLQPAPVSIPPTNYISKVTGPRGLTFITSSNVFSYDVGQEQFQRQNIRTVNLLPSWVGSPKPVTYWLTITNYPSVTYSNFQTQIWLVDGAASANAPDYNNAAVVSFSINQNADGTANGHLAYKVNQPFGNAMFTGSGNLGDVFSASVLGTWSMSFTNDDSVIITSPSGSTFSTTLASGDGTANFADGLTIYLDSQAILVNNIGQKSVFSKFQVVSNNVTLFSDDFSSGALNSSKWDKTQAEDPANVYQIPITAAFKVSWTLPDSGFSLQSTTNLLSSWTSNGVPTAVINGQRSVFVSQSNVATNRVQFFRLIQQP